VLLKFFTLLTLMMSNHNESFFNLAEFHEMLVDVALPSPESQRRTKNYAHRSRAEDFFEPGSGLH